MPQISSHLGEVCSSGYHTHMRIRLRYPFLVTAMATLSLACSDDGPSPVDAASIDAAADAASVVVDAASPIPDASILDASILDASSTIDVPPGVFSLTSSVIADGGVFPLAHTCQGINVSPPLMWIEPPARALGFAVVFTDLDNGLIHSVIWDIPGAVSSLPTDVDKVYEPPDVPGAKQTRAYNPNVRGYLGPCPPNEHTYQFELHAVDTATLPGVGFDSTRQNVVDALSGHIIDTVVLTASHNPNARAPRPAIR